MTALQKQEAREKDEQVSSLAANLEQCKERNDRDAATIHQLTAQLTELKSEFLTLAERESVPIVQSEIKQHQPPVQERFEPAKEEVKPAPIQTIPIANKESKESGTYVFCYGSNHPISMAKMVNQPI